MAIRPDGAQPPVAPTPSPFHDHVGGCGTYVPEMCLFWRVWSAKVGRKRGLGTVRILDPLTYLFSVSCNGGEGGIRPRSRLRR
jgi:hypothetical protein